jgi:hypothetical protein
VPPTINFCFFLQRANLIGPSKKKEKKKETMDTPQNRKLQASLQNQELQF